MKSFHIEMFVPLMIIGAVFGGKKCGAGVKNTSLSTG
jgi:hypothetical protein